jgi:bacillopeptidase F
MSSKLQAAFFTFLLVCLNLAHGQSTLQEAYLSSEILEQLPKANANSRFKLIISLKKQLDLAQWSKSELRAQGSHEAKIRAFVEALEAQAAQAQPRILEWMKTLPGGIPSSIRGYWIANAIAAEGNLSFLTAVSNHPDVEWIELTPELMIEQGTRHATPAPPLTPGGIEPGLAAINARALWRLGYTGYGRKALIIDSGQEHEHPALRTQFAYHTGTRNATYYSPIVGDLCGDHGTAVAGCVLGLDRMTRDTVGVAFNAQWIGGPTNFRNPDGTLCPLAGSNADAADVLQWALNPDGNAATTSDIPDVVNNSYGRGRNVEDCRSVFRTIIQNLDFAGVAVVFSAGNSGPNASTINLPSAMNLDLVVPMSVGSINANSPSFPVSDFSSRGPTICGRDGSLLIKPEVVAPGERVRTTSLNGAYTTIDGTSFSAPYVTGAILLLKEAFPTLPGRTLALALYNSATDLGDLGEDNTYGKGLINIGAAYNLLVSQGNRPVAPSRPANDVINVQTKPRIFSCDSKAYIEVTFENAGTDTLRSLEVVARQEGSSGAFTTARWDGKLAPGRLTSFNVPAFAAPLGRFIMEIELRNPNGQNDGRPLNNRIKTAMTVTSTPQLPNASTTSSNICVGSRAFLRASHNTSGSIRWYDKNVGGRLIASGNTLHTGPLNRDTTFYADLSFNETTGMKTPVGAKETFASDSLGGLVFDAYYPFVLKTVTIYPTTTGLRIINLRGAPGSVAQQRLINISRTGEQKVTLNFNVIPGDNQVLELSRGGGMTVAETIDGGFPYNIAEVMVIKEANNTKKFNQYPYFYNWEIEYGYPCGRTPVFIDTRPSTSNPLSQFTIPNNVVTGTPANFSPGNVSNASQIRWEFGDGQSSTERNAAQVYRAPGIYQVALAVTGPDGCADVSFANLQVTGNVITSTQEQDLLASQIAVFPNPAKHHAVLDLKLDQSRNVEVSIHNGIGQNVRQLNLGKVQNALQDLDLKALPKGAYWVIIMADGIRIAKPLQVIGE